MAERPHSVEDVRRVARPPRDSGNGLFVGCVRVAKRDHNAHGARRIHERERTRELRRERQDACPAPRRIKQLAQQFGRSGCNPLLRMHTPARPADERAFEVNAEQLGHGIAGRHRVRL